MCWARATWSFFRDDYARCLFGGVRWHFRQKRPTFRRMSVIWMEYIHICMRCGSCVTSDSKPLRYTSVSLSPFFALWKRGSRARARMCTHASKILDRSPRERFPRTHFFFFLRFRGSTTAEIRRAVRCNNTSVTLISRDESCKTVWERIARNTHECSYLFLFSIIPWKWEGKE